MGSTLPGDPKRLITAATSYCHPNAARAAFCSLGSTFTPRISLSLTPTPRRCDPHSRDEEIPGLKAGRRFEGPLGQEEARWVSKLWDFNVRCSAFPRCPPSPPLRGPVRRNSTLKHETCTRTRNDRNRDPARFCLDPHLEADRFYNKVSPE